MGNAFLAPRYEQAARALVDLNERTERYGLALTPAEALWLVRARAEALLLRDRVEFGEGVTAKLIDAFCDSPYLLRETYAETLSELTDAFYLYKNETNDRIPDDEILSYMKRAFNGVCQGSMELLTGKSLFALTGGELNVDDSREEDEADE